MSASGRLMKYYEAENKKGKEAEAGGSDTGSKSWALTALPEPK